MRYLSVCSGIEAASQAFRPLGWEPVAFSEIEPFPCAYLAHHYPETPNWGDMTRFKEWPDATIDLLCGGTPCQSFSVAGLRKGLADPRGNLMLTYLAIAARYQPRWIVWENVPGVLSSNSGRDFGTFLWALGELGYGYAYRVLDAQHVRTRRFPFAVPQRRRRVFVVGHLGDWRRAAAVLFDRESLSGHPAPGRKAGQGIAPTISARPTGGGGLGTDFDLDGGLIPQGYGGETAPTLNAAFGSKLGLDNQHIDSGAGLFVSHTLRGEGFDASEDGTGRGTPLASVAYRTAGDGAVYEEGDITAPLTTQTDPNAQVVAFSSKDYGAQPWAVRRLTTRECERLMGFPDDYTRIPWGARKKIEAHELLYIRLTNPDISMDEARRLAADGPRYKALGNSWAVNCAEWIGERIAEVDQW